MLGDHYDSRVCLVFDEGHDNHEGHIHLYI